MLDAGRRRPIGDATFEGGAIGAGTRLTPRGGVVTMKTVLLAAVMTGLLLTSSWAATTVNSSRSNSSERLQGKFVTATAQLSGADDTQTVYTTPTSGDFILTQICVSPSVTGGIRLDASGFGSIAHLGVAGHGCQTFSVGVLLPRGSPITCSTFAEASAGSYFCAISGSQN
jgi:hypothetical protein